MLADFLESSLESLDEIGGVKDHGDFPSDRVEPISDLLVLEEEIEVSSVDFCDGPRANGRRDRRGGASAGGGGGGDGVGRERGEAGFLGEAATFDLTDFRRVSLANHAQGLALPTPLDHHRFTVGNSLIKETK